MDHCVQIQRVLSQLSQMICQQWLKYDLSADKRQGNQEEG